MNAFDRVAAVYDELWTNTTIGRLQRAAVWRQARPVFAAGDRVLELGCGTGEDALWLERQGVTVTPTDSSPAMVRMAWQRGVEARLLRIEDIGQVDGVYDGVFSNFGALNCVESIPALRGPLARLIRPGGHLALCIIGRFCLWETCWYLRRAEFRKARRRWGGRAYSRPGVDVFYPRCSRMQQALSPHFTLLATTGIGVLVPPSYVTGLSNRTLETLARIDARIAGWPGVRALADHRLLLFRRL
ncbi:MAG: methyltransferase domain-containing protein [Acidobacteriota bacterium]